MKNTRNEVYELVSSFVTNGFGDPKVKASDITNMITQFVINYNNQPYEYQDERICDFCERTSKSLKK